MKKYAVIRLDTGECVQIQRLTMIDDSVINNETDGLIYKDITTNEYLLENGEMEFRNRQYWKDNKWTTREPRPTPYHFWRDYEWVQDLTVLFRSIREHRDARLFGSDWTQAADVPFSDETKELWLHYRQQLRELPETYKDATTWEEVQWPPKPMTN